MDSDLDIRLQAYFTTAEPQAAGDPRPCANALSSSVAAATAASAAIIGGHTRILRPEPVPSYVPTGQNELDFLIAKKAENHPASQADQQAPDDAAVKSKLPLPPGHNSLDHLVKGAAGVPFFKTQNA